MWNRRRLFFNLFKVNISALILALIIPTTAEARQTILSDEIVSLCEQYGDEYDIDRLLIMAFCEIESSGRANVVSANGQYIGLMQLNKDTFSGDLTDPANNIQQGAEYLHRLRERNDNNMITAISYYSGEAGRLGFYTRKVLNRYFELVCTYEYGRENRCL